MVKGRKKKKKEPVADEEERPVHLRGEEYEVDKLTGKRATKGKLPGGAPNKVRAAGTQRGKADTLADILFARENVE